MSKLEIITVNGWKHLYDNGKFVDKSRASVKDTTIFACYENRMKRTRPNEVRKSVIQGYRGLHAFLTSHPDFQEQPAQSVATLGQFNNIIRLS